MRPKPSSPEALARMRRQARTNTRPEQRLRSELHRRGLRYRVERTILPASRRRHDIVFSRAQVVVDVRGCFWHSCPTHGTSPKANRDWWAQKLAANVDRDKDTEDLLRAGGWAVVIVWEHEDPVEAAARIERTVRERH